MYREGIVQADLVAHFNWDKVTIFSSPGSLSTVLLVSRIAELGIHILSQHDIQPGTTDLSSPIHIAKSVGSRIFVLNLSPSDAYTLLQQGYAKGLFDHRSQIIGGEALSSITAWQGVGMELDEMNLLLGGMLAVQWKPFSGSTEAVSSFVGRWKSRPSTTGSVDNNGNKICDPSTDSFGSFPLYQFYPDGNTSLSPVCAGVDFTQYADDGSDLMEVMYAYDAVIAVGASLHALISEQGISDPTPLQLSTYLTNEYSGVGLTGPISFSSEYKSIRLDVGGRNTGLLYTIVNYQQASSIFSPVSLWSSESRLISCDTHNVPCNDIVFGTRDNTPPLASPPPHVRVMSSGMRWFLRAWSIVALLISLTTILVLALYRRRRLVKMSQPLLSSMSALGCICGSIRVILATQNLSNESCAAEMWTAHLGFLCIFSPILVRIARVYLVTAALRRKKLKEESFLLCALMIVSLGCVILVVISTSTHPHVTLVTIEDNQFQYILEPKCDIAKREWFLALFSFEGLILLIGVCGCYAIRNVNSTICHTMLFIKGMIWYTHNTRQTHPCVVYLHLSHPPVSCH
jgi:hypothetical protein